MNWNDEDTFIDIGNSIAEGDFEMSKMEYAGQIDSEPYMAGYLPDGRRIYVHELAHFENAPVEQAFDPVYWQQRHATGEFVDPENAPYVWIERRD